MPASPPPLEIPVGQPDATLAVLGHPVGHSLSPAMHNAVLRHWAASDGRWANWRYEKIDVPPGRLPEALARLHDLRYAGLNLTIPHKVEAVPLVCEIDPQAARLGAVNTLLWKPHGWAGANTDGYGLSRAVETELGRPLQGAVIVQLGAGGAARAVAAQCLLSGCAELWIGNRDQDRLNELLAILMTPGAPAIPLRGFDLRDPPADLPRRALLINVTSLGLRPDDPPPIDPDLFEDGSAVYDSTYGRHQSRLLRAALARGWPAANGLSMLVWQGARSLELWTGRTPPADLMRAAAEEALAGH